MNALSHRARAWFATRPHAAAPGAVLIGLLIALEPAAARAQVLTYSAADDFSLSNPSGPWSYGYGFSLWAAPLSVSGSTSQYAWWSAGDYPYVERNLTGTTIYEAGVFLPADHLILIPANSASVIVRFTAPHEATYTFSGDFMQLEPLVRVASWEGAVVSTRGTTLTPVSGNLGGWSGQTVPIEFTQELLVGDTVDFIVWANGNNWGDNTGLKVQVTAVPEPGGWGLVSGMGLAVAATALRISRNRRQPAA